jgi:tRNA/tmRNA/rRNA uracil-C5-methylase (TrmA/RlmC/RlmD family)
MSESVHIDRAAVGGAVGRLPDGRAVFVRGALPGEEVEVEVTEDHSTYARGRVSKVLQASAERVTPFCPYAHPTGCGGCDLAHASPTAQREWKESVAADQLRRLGSIERTVELQAVEPALHGRTRIRCQVDETGHLAFRRAASSELISINSCPASDERFSEALTADWMGAQEVELRALGNEEPYAVVTLADGQVVTSDLDGLIDEEPRRSHVVVGKHRFRVSAGSFWQAHREAPHVLTEAVMKAAGVGRGDHVVDLYSGVGLFAVPLAVAVGPTGTVVAIEAGSSSAGDARRNAADYPQITIRKARVNANSVRDVITSQSVVVLDPPRTGADKGAISTIATIQPRRLVYVSCDVATLARDLKTLTAAGYRISTFRTFDLFPQTEHIEAVVTLDRNAR